MLAALAYPVGLRREVQVLQAARREIALSIDTVLSIRARTDRLVNAIEALNLEHAGAPRWSEALAALASALPRSAYLTAFRGVADTLVIEGLAAEATEAVEGLAALSDLEDLRALGPIRREITSDDRSIDRFTLGATVEWHGGAQPLRLSTPAGSAEASR
jgi:hypothetical protein